MTDTETIKELEKALKVAEETINRQKAEKENLEIEIQAMRNAANGYKAEVEELKKGINIELENYASEYDNKIKAEAVKEFAERLIHKIVNTPTKFPSKYFMYHDGIKFRQDEIIEIIQGMVGDDE